MSNLTEQEKRAAVVVALSAGRSPPEISKFLKLSRSLVYRVKKVEILVQEKVYIDKKLKLKKLLCLNLIFKFTTGSFLIKFT